MIGPYWKGTQQAASSLPPKKEPTTALVSTEHVNTAEKAKEKDNLMNISTGDSNGTTEEDRMSNSTKSLFNNELPQTHQSLTKKPLVALKRRTFRNTTAGHDESAPDWKRQKRSKPTPTKTPLQNKDSTKSPVMVSVEDHHTMQKKGSSWMDTGVRLFAATQYSKPSTGLKRGPYDDCDI